MVADLDLVLQKYLTVNNIIDGFTPFKSSPIFNWLKLPQQDHINERLKTDFKLYKDLRKQYPDHKLIFSGHSLGAVVVKHILDNADKDKNIEGHLFNHWIFNNLDKKVKDDKRLFLNDSDDYLKKPLRAFTGGGAIVGGVAGAASNYAYNRQLNSYEFQTHLQEELTNYDSVLESMTNVPAETIAAREKMIEESFGVLRKGAKVAKWTSGILAFLYLMGLGFFAHSSDNFKPKDKNLLIKK